MMGRAQSVDFLLALEVELGEQGRHAVCVLQCLTCLDPVRIRLAKIAHARLLLHATRARMDRAPSKKSMPVPALRHLCFGQGASLNRQVMRLTEAKELLRPLD